MDPQMAVHSTTHAASPEEGLRAVVALHQLADRLEFEYVQEALRAGMSWQQIATILGVSRQAAHKKYAKRIDPSIPIPRRHS
ncbi:MAG: hypothetical protein SPF30_04465 [Arcanobacterium sp.]|nr:hypothetical protein [Arcanobacterium sp.]